MLSVKIWSKCIETRVFRRDRMLKACSVVLQSCK